MEIQHNDGKMCITINKQTYHYNTMSAKDFITISKSIIPNHGLSDIYMAEIHKILYNDQKYLINEDTLNAIAKQLPSPVKQLPSPVKQLPSTVKQPQSRAKQNTQQVKQPMRFGGKLKTRKIKVKKIKKQTHKKIKKQTHKKIKKQTHKKIKKQTHKKFKKYKGGDFGATFAIVLTGMLVAPILAGAIFAVGHGLYRVGREVVDGVNLIYAYEKRNNSTR
jgi:hypothetical protein